MTNFKKNPNVFIEQHKCGNCEHVTLIMGAGLGIPTWSRLPFSHFQHDIS